ncbi:MAG: hypothetical protein V7L31_31205 [Nostoc sp.]|uniref:hypothetical protein n=1 Tax=Nostoc sp. TaxID=1180 RepID=UPI002FEEEEA0
MKIINLKDAINWRLYNHQSFVLALIHRVSCLKRTVLDWVEKRRLKEASRRVTQYFQSFVGLRFISFPVSDWECHPKGSASLAGWRQSRQEQHFQPEAVKRVSA